MRYRFVLVAACATIPSAAYAHSLRGHPPDEVLSAWFTDPWAMLSLGIVASLYARGVGRVWSRAGRGRGIPIWRYRSFCAGLFVAGVALLSPIDPAGASVFSAHMVQHELLMLVAAPLLVLGAPTAAFAWAMPRPVTRAVRRGVRLPPIRRILQTVASPVGATMVHAIALWAWHVPELYEATIANEFVHLLQHVSFFGSALLLWWVVAKAISSAAHGGVAAVLLLVTMLHGNALGALMTFAPRPWYPSYASTTRAWGLTPLEDQQLGGVLMWVPAGMIYMAASLIIIRRWLQRAG